MTDNEDPEVPEGFPTMEQIKKLVRSMNNKAPEAAVSIHQASLDDPLTFVSTGFQISFALAVNEDNPEDTFTTPILVFMVAKKDQGSKTFDFPPDGDEVDYLHIVISDEGLRSVGGALMHATLCPSLVDDLNEVISIHEMNQCERCKEKPNAGTADPSD